MMPTTEYAVIIRDDIKVYEGDGNHVAIPIQEVTGARVVLHTHPPDPSWPLSVGPSPHDIAELWSQGVREFVLIEPGATWVIRFPDTLSAQDQHLEHWQTLLDWLQADEELEWCGQRTEMATLAKRALDRLGLQYTVLEAT